MNVIKNKRAFTLIEIIMVILIIGILMGATMRFGGDRIGFLNNKNVKEQFMSSYDSLYSNNMMTSYNLGDIYENLEIDFVLGKTGVSYLYRGYGSKDIFSDTTRVDGGEYKILNLSVNGDKQDNISIFLKPYILGCEINGFDSSLARIELLVNHSKNYCFEINSDSCRLLNILCD